MSEKIAAVYKQIPGADIDPGWYAYWTYPNGDAWPMPNIVAGPFRRKRQAERCARAANQGKPITPSIMAAVR
jgi:hypothetical protein